MDKIEISVDRVETNENINDCTCSICQNIFYKPVMCKNCENHFCTECIDEWISNHPGKCPFCQNFEKKKPSIILNNILDKLKISCVYKEKGCKDILRYESLIKHEASCAFSGKIETKYEKLKKLNAGSVIVNLNQNKISLDNSVSSEKENNFRNSDNVENYYDKENLNNTFNRYLSKKVVVKSFANEENDDEKISKKVKPQTSKNVCTDINSKFSSEVPCKVVLLGESGVGKTCLLNRYVNNYFRNTQPTPGAGYSCKHAHYPEYDKNVKFEIWDTAGQEKFRSLTKIFYRDASCVILIYDVTRKSSFDEVKTYWFNQVYNKNENIIIFLCGNKDDMSEYEEVNREEVENFAKEYKLTLCSTSAKDNTGIQEMFREIGKKIILMNFPQREENEDSYPKSVKDKSSIKLKTQQEISLEEEANPRKKADCKC